MFGKVMGQQGVEYLLILARPCDWANHHRLTTMF